ncbi:hypothetical protein J4W08_25150, partial [Escherichia coli]
LKENNRCEYLYGHRVYKKWGEEEYIVNGLGIKIKKLGINPDCKILIHSDEFYDKHILVIAGTFMLTLETERNIMLEHGYLYMPEGGEKCSFYNNGDKVLELLEIFIRKTHKY